MVKADNKLSSLVRHQCARLVTRIPRVICTGSQRGLPYISHTLRKERERDCDISGLENCKSLYLVQKVTADTQIHDMDQSVEYTHHMEYHSEFSWPYCPYACTKVFFLLRLLLFSSITIIRVAHSKTRYFSHVWSAVAFQPILLSSHSFECVLWF
jgi:hypothetical protein